MLIGLVAYVSPNWLAGPLTGIGQARPLYTSSKCKNYHPLARAGAAAARATLYHNRSSVSILPFSCLFPSLGETPEDWKCSRCSLNEMAPCAANAVSLRKGNNRRVGAAKDAKKIPFIDHSSTDSRGNTFGVRLKCCVYNVRCFISNVRYS